MRHQPSQSKQERPEKAPAAAPKGTKCSAALASAAFLGVPFQGDGFAAMPSDAATMFTAILSVLAVVLGLSASILYRHMHHREEELRRRAEDAEAEQRALMMISDEAVLVLAADGKVRAANPAAEELFDREADEFLGHPLTEILAQPLALGELTRHGPVNFVTTARHSDEECSQVEMLLSPVDLSSGKGYVAVLHRPRETEGGKTAADSGLRSTVEKFTHDLNNQLTSLLGNLSLALMARPGDPATHDRVLNAKKTALRAQVLSVEFQSFLNPSNDEPTAQPAQAAQPTNKDMNCTILPMPPSSTAAARPPAPPAPARILILDDEEAICMLITSVLEASGYDMASAVSAADAVRACEEAQRAGNPFSLVICDLSLGGEEDGIEALRQLRTIDPDIKAIVSSGYDSDPVMRNCRKFGFCAAMAKPYDVGKLIRTVGSVLKEDASLLMTA
jgi:CheY-like chemotaxis protein